MKKKFLSLFLVLTAIFNLAAVVPAGAIEYGAKATADFSAGKAKLTNVSTMSVPNNAYDFVTRDDRKALRMLHAEGGYFLRFNLDTSVFPVESGGAPAAVTVEYFDEGKGYFTLRYDSVENRVLGQMEDHADIIRMEDTQTWKSHTFYMEDATYKGNWNGAFNIAMYSLTTGGTSPGDIIVGRVEIEKCFPRNPISRSLTSGHVGNIFGGNEEKKLAWEFENTVEVEVSAKTEWAVFDEYGNLRGSDSLEKTYAPGEKYTHEWIPEVEEYGIFKVNEKTTVKYIYNGEEGTTVSSNVYDFSIVNKFEEGEKKNEKMEACTHILYGRDAAMTAEVASQAGFYKLRDEIQWSNVEKSKGQYEFTELMDFPYEFENESLKFHFIADYGNTIYKSCTNVKTIPDTEEDLQAFVNYMMKLVDRYSDQISSVEIWNEPNNADFNGGHEGNTQMAAYTKLVKTCYPVIKEKYPDKQVVIFGMAGADFANVTAAMELGIYDYCDVVSVHPYQWSGKYSEEQYRNELTKLREIMAQYGDGEVKEVWLTEMGWTSGNNCRAGVTPEEQASFIVRNFVTGVGEGLIDEYYLYELQCGGIKIGDQENNFGVVGQVIERKQEVEDIFEAPDFTAANTPWSAKRSYVAIAEMNKQLAEAEVERINDIGEKRDAYQFVKKGGEKVNVIWSYRDEAENLSFSVDGTAKVLDMYGNTIKEPNGKDDSYTATLGVRPIYIEGNYSELIAKESEISCSATEITIANGESFDLEFADTAGRDLKLDMKLPDAFEMLEGNETFADGKSNIKLATTDKAASGKQKIRIDVYDGDELAANLEVNVEIIEPVEMFILESKNQNSLDRHVATVTITNTSEHTTYNGECKIIEPIELSENANVAHFSALKPGESINVQLSLPRTVAKTYYNMKVLTALDNGKSVTLSKSIKLESWKNRLLTGNSILISKTDTAPEIDGVISEGEWKGEPLVINTEDKWESTGGNWNGSEDMSYKAWLGWDDEYFYLAAEVEDDVFMQNNIASQMWQGDCIQIGIISGEPERVSGSKYNEYGISLLSDGPSVYRFMATSDYYPVGNVENVDIAITQDGTKTYYEMRMPWNEVMGQTYKPQEGDSVTFNMIVDDCDVDFRKGCIGLTKGIASGKNPGIVKKCAVEKSPKFDKR